MHVTDISIVLMSYGMWVKYVLYHGVCDVRSAEVASCKTAALDMGAHDQWVHVKAPETVVLRIAEVSRTSNQVLTSSK
jgi:hypothetical protein